MMTVEMSESYAGEVSELNAEDEKTRQPYVRVSYEENGGWMVLGSFAEYSSGSRELGAVILGLVRDAEAEMPGNAEEIDRVMVHVVYLTDAEVRDLPEFPGW